MKQILPILIAALIFFTALVPATAAPTSQHASGATHVVQRGDTLYSIAGQYGTTVAELMETNGLNSDVIWVGQVLHISSSMAVGQTTHTVVGGDTLYSLARRYGTTVDAIMQMNGLTSTIIYVGQPLLITSSEVPMDGTTIYTVVQGDTLYAIARRYGTSVEAIMASNNLSSPSIYVGQQLYIRSGVTPHATTTLPTATATPTVSGTPVASPTSATPTVSPATTPTPTLTRTPTGVVIQNIQYDGEVAQVESDEYATITNSGTVPQDISGWRLYADDAGQNFIFPSFELAPGQSCRVYTDEVHPESCGFSFERGSAIWNNEGDCGHLYNASGAEVSRYCYD